MDETGQRRSVPTNTVTWMQVFVAVAAMAATAGFTVSQVGSKTEILGVRMESLADALQGLSHALELNKEDIRANTRELGRVDSRLQLLEDKHKVHPVPPK